MDEINALVQERLKKLSSLEAPYGRRFADTRPLTELASDFEEGKPARVAGRLMAIRGHGKTVFADLHDEKGKIQLYLKEDLLAAEAFELFSSKVDIGDILGAEGTLFK